MLLLICYLLLFFWPCRLSFAMNPQADRLLQAPYLPPPSRNSPICQSVQSRHLLCPPILFTEIETSRTYPQLSTGTVPLWNISHEVHRFRNVWGSPSLWLSEERQTVECQPQGPNEMTSLHRRYRRAPGPLGSPSTRMRCGL
jgi:hypothetical protein